METNLTIFFAALEAWTKEFPHAAPQIQHLLVPWRVVALAAGRNEARILVDIS